MQSIGGNGRTQRVTDNDAPFFEPQAMLAELRQDNAGIARCLHEAHGSCDKASNIVTARQLLHYRAPYCT